MVLSDSVQVIEALKGGFRHSCCVVEFLHSMWSPCFIPSHYSKPQHDKENSRSVKQNPYTKHMLTSESPPENPTRLDKTENNNSSSNNNNKTTATPKKEKPHCAQWVDALLLMRLSTPLIFSWRTLWKHKTVLWGLLCLLSAGWMATNLMISQMKFMMRCLNTQLSKMSTGKCSIKEHLIPRR